MVNTFEIPIEQAMIPKTGECFVDEYWYVVDDCILVMYNRLGLLYSMCNNDQKLLRDLYDYSLEDGEYDYEIKKLPFVYKESCQHYLSVSLKLQKK